MLIIVQKDHDRFIFAGDEIAVSFRQQFISQSSQQSEGVIIGFWDPVIGEKSQSSVIQLNRDLQCFFKIRQAPVAKGIQTVIVFQKILHQVTGFETGVVDQIPMGDGKVPLCQIDWQVAHVVLS